MKKKINIEEAIIKTLFDLSIARFISNRASLPLMERLLSIPIRIADNENFENYLKNHIENTPFSSQAALLRDIRVLTNSTYALPGMQIYGGELSKTLFQIKPPSLSHTNFFKQLRPLACKFFNNFLTCIEDRDTIPSLPEGENIGSTPIASSTTLKKYIAHAYVTIKDNLLKEMGDAVPQLPQAEQKSNGWGR